MPLPPLMVQIFSSSSSLPVAPWVDARLPQPEAPAVPVFLLLSSLSALHGILHSRKEGERESGMLPGEYGRLLDLESTATFTLKQNIAHQTLSSARLVTWAI